MGCSLNLIVALIIASVALLVGGACLGVTLGLGIQSMDAIGRGYAKQINTGLASSTGKYFADVEATMASADAHAKINAPLTPSLVTGHNWTQDWIPWLMSVNARRNFTINSINTVFFDHYWTSTARSGLFPATKVIFEFFENPLNKYPPTQSEVGGGGTRWIQQPDGGITQDMTMVGTPTESYGRGVSFVPAGGAAWDQLVGIIANRKTSPGCMWLQTAHVYYTDIEVYWSLIGACSIRNSTGDMFGLSVLSVDPVKELRGLIASVSRSPNGHNLIVDGSGFMLSSTYPAPIYTSVPTTVGGRVPNGCSSTEEVGKGVWVPPRLGCRFTPETYDYEPVRGLSPDFYNTVSNAITEVSVGGGYLVASRRVTTKLGGLSVNVISVIPFSDIFGGVDAGRNIAIGIVCGILAAAVLIAVLITYIILKPLDTIAHKMLSTAQLENLDEQDELGEDDDDDHEGKDEEMQHLTSPGSPDDSALGASSGSGSVSMAAALEAQEKKNKKKLEVEKTSPSSITEIQALELAYAASHRSLVNFTRYVSINVLRELLFSKVGSDLNSVHVTLSSTDVRSFTSLCEKVQPDVLSRILVEYFQRASSIVMGHAGIIQMFVGDAIMAVWNAPFPTPCHELLGVLNGLALQREVSKNPLRSIFRDVGFDLAVRTGVASGPALVGAIGSSQRLQYSVLGQAAATANGIEPFAKPWGLDMLCDETAARAVHEYMGLRLVCNAKFPGRTHPCLCYEPLGVLPGAKIRNADHEGAKGYGSEAAGAAGMSDTDDMGSAASRKSDLSSAGTSASGTSASPFGSPIGGGAFEGGEVDLEKILRWHKKRNPVEDRALAFGAAFSDAARLFIDKDFKACKKKLEEMEQDTAFSMEQRQQKSLTVLAGYATSYAAADNEFIKRHTDGKQQIFIGA